MFFETYLLCSYNKNVGLKILTECDCYKLYSTEEAFVKTIIENRESYMACICYESNVRTRIGHRSIPIMIGSYIDYRIRGAKAVIESRSLWGLVILRGLLKIYSSFSTFDALSMHVRETKYSKSIEWFTYVNNNGLALSYNNKMVSWVYNRQTLNNTISNDWVHLIKEANPFNTEIHSHEYINMFDTILKYPYSMNDLKIRQIINGPTIIKKYINYDLNRRRKRKATGCQKISTAFEKGTLFQVLSKKNSVDIDEWYKNYPQNYDNTMHEGRSNKTAHFLPNITRASNAAVRNSSALTFPKDGMYYYCMLNTKDLKSAGEQNVLCDYVIMTEETDQIMLFNELRKNYNDAGGSCTLVINGFLINCKCDWTLDKLITLKKMFPFVTTQYNLPFVRFSTRSCIPIKYSDKHDTFFSPAETTHFNIEYNESDLMSITAKELNLNILRKTPPAKSTVSINNIKGSIAKVTSPLHLMLMENSLGVTSYMNISQEAFEKLIDYAVISDGHDTADFERNFAEICEEFKIGKLYDKTNEVQSTDTGKAMLKLALLYPKNDLLIECKKIVNGPITYFRNIANAKKTEEYQNIIFSGKYFRPPNLWNLRLRAAFGNPFGACIEDGVVIDSNILKHIPPIYYNACITIDFTFKTIKQPKDAQLILIDERNGSIENDTLIGCLISEHQAFVKNSKHSKIISKKIGSHYYYLIHFLPKRTKMYDNLKIRHIYNSNSITIVITGQNKTEFGVGSKIANSFGQKNVISMITDKLPSTCWGITRDGRKVHAQIVYSDVSLISRLLSGQIYDMFMSNELAIGPNKTIIAPVDLVIHTLHPYTNIKVFDIKVDTLTNINGFDSQNLSNVSSYLRSSTTHQKVLQVLGLHGYDIDFKARPADKPIIISENSKLYGTTLNESMCEAIINEYDNCSSSSSSGHSRKRSNDNTNGGCYNGKKIKLQTKI